jgi:hypothetical protein
MVDGANPGTKADGSSAEPGTKDDGSSLKTQLELLKFLREEAEANRSAQRTESDANRKLLRDMFWIASPVLTIVIAVSGVLLAHDLNTFKQSLKLEAEADTKLEIEKENKKIEREIEGTLQQQFKTDNIKTTIKAAAEVATRDEAPGLIKDVITPEVRKAVGRESGTIKDIAAKAAIAKVQQTIDPLAKEASETVAQLRIHDLIERANSDDANAFDELLKLRATGSPSQQELVKRVIAERYSHVGDRMQPGGPSSCEDPSLFSRMLDSPDTTYRLNMATSCGNLRSVPAGTIVRNGNKSISILLFEQQVLPKLVELGIKDPSLAVRASAISGVNNLFDWAPGFPRNGLDFLDNRGLKDWWRTNQSSYIPLLLLSRSRASGLTPPNFDSVDLYEALKKVKGSSPTALGNTIDETLSGMREMAARQPPSALLEKSLGRSTCSDVESDFDARLKSWGVKPDLADVDDYGQLEIEYLETCPKAEKFLPWLVDSAVSSPSLKRRYAATTVINRWLNAKLDPFDSVSIRGWWAQREQK